jgi:riboflavin kinase/FMN adenylyltransferase
LKVIHDIEEFNPQGDVYLTQGTFDGVHIGHKKILSKLVAEAKEKKAVSVLLTFFPHPRLVLFPEDNDLKMLNTLDEKTALVEELGLDYLIVLPFTKELSRTKADLFTRDVLINKLKMNKLIIGYDHRFGKNREGSLEQMKEFADLYDFVVEEIPAQDIDDSIVSSTKIRKAILGGEIDLGNKLLGYKYYLSGKVVEGKKEGKKMGFPTANISVENQYKLIPSNGVYAVNVTLGGNKYGGMLNIGYNPTFINKGHSIEVHIFEFDKEVYGEAITVEFLTKIRDEQKFNHPDQLKLQLEQDEKHIKKILSSH